VWVNHVLEFSALAVWHRDLHKKRGADKGGEKEGGGEDMRVKYAQIQWFARIQRMPHGIAICTPTKEKWEKRGGKLVCESIMHTFNDVLAHQCVNVCIIDSHTNFPFAEFEQR